MNVRHYLEVYKTRQDMQASGVTNPSIEIKRLTNEIVVKLSKMPLEERLDLVEMDGRLVLKDSEHNIVVIFPKNFGKDKFK